MMDNVKVYNLIDSLGELQRIAPQLIAEKAVKGIVDFCAPVAISVKILSPGMKPIEKSVGTSSHLEILKKYENKFKGLDVASAEFALDFARGQIINCVSIRHPKEYSGLISVLTDAESPSKHIIRQIIDLYTGNIILALSLRSLERYFNIMEFIEKVFPELRHFNVEGILIYREENPQKAYWIEQNEKKQVAIDGKLMKLFADNSENLDTELSDEIHSMAFSKHKFKNIAWHRFSLGGKKIICLFAGKFKKSELVFSKFRSLVADIDQPTGYNDIVQAFRRLKEDHKQVVKGERVAAILETAVAINHEINNPLTAVLGNTQLLLLQEDQLPEEVIVKIKVIEKSALRIRQVTQKLMSVVEPVTTSYTDSLEMLDIKKSSIPDQ
ncbi:MAG: hypothetical protein GY839_17430 [candidate division Zixibacteria bacterium]|nr:hypothetical protein [candidate division Zixibacteria bacterium]